MKAVFFGTPSFSTPFLDALIKDNNIDVIGVVTQPDKPSGRGGKTRPTPVKAMAEDHTIPVFQFPTLKSSEASVELAELDADVFIVVAYGKLIPKNILDIPPHGCVNVHPSRLPKYRGPSPMQFAIAEGESNTGITIMLLDAGMDTGPILSFENISLDAEETYPTLEAKVHAQGPKLLVQTLKRFLAGEITPEEQNDTEATLTKLLEREDGHVNWEESMTTILRKQRAYYPWPGSWNTLGDMRLKWLEMRAADVNADVPPGVITVKENRLYVDAVDGTIEITTLQPEGKPPMDANAFLAGAKELSGEKLS